MKNQLVKSGIHSRYKVTFSFENWNEVGIQNSASISIYCTYIFFNCCLIWINKKRLERASMEPYVHRAFLMLNVEHTVNARIKICDGIGNSTYIEMYPSKFWANFPLLLFLKHSKYFYYLSLFVLSFDIWKTLNRLNSSKPTYFITVHGGNKLFNM